MNRYISAALAVCLGFLSMLPFFHQTYALDTYRTVTKYHLDMGVIHIWSSDNGVTWQNNLEYGKTPSEPFTASPTFPNKIQKVVKAYVLEEGDFKWNDTTGVYTFNKVETYLTSEGTYSKNYKPYMSNAISSIKASMNGDYTVELSYKAKLQGLDASYNLSDMLNRDKFDDIIALLGGEGSVKRDLYEKLEDGKEGVGAGVLGYMFFIPIVIEYQVIEKVTLEIGEFEAGLDAPATAMVGETFNVTDESLFGDEAEFAETRLRYCVDGGSTKTVTGWKGNALRETILQSFGEACTVEYTITTWNIYGNPDTDSKTVRIITEEEAVESEIAINPDLVLPEYTYEGHTETASDQSTFVVDGVDYSASRTYAEGLARSSYKASSGTVSIHKSNNTRAECTFSQKGTYDITLDIRAEGGARASDTESIEVRKTPYIIDHLAGFQKQNRKQVLNITVATYPGKPLTEFSIDLKDKLTGEQLRLTQDNLQESNATIKTRTVTMEQDLEKGFAYITLEFLTRTPAYRAADPNYTQDFYYEINVKDSKGDTDRASKTFTVKPDRPPVPAISLDTAFLRNEGTNFASVKTEDVTVAVDGDEVERTWYFGHGLAPASYTNIATMDGYQKLSFGTDKIVGFNKVGVGKFTVKLFVKEKWTEPTLEEYVTDTDRLTGTVTAPSDVFNVAPIVSLEMMKGITKDVLLLANNDSEYQTLTNHKTALKQNLLADKIDADIVIKKLIGSSPADVTGVTAKLNITFPAPRFGEGGMSMERNSLANDSERAYIETWTWINNEPTIPVSVQAYNPYSGLAWQYTTTRNERFSFGQDDMGKYLYLIYSESNQTVLLDKRTGTVAGTLAKAMPSYLWLTDDSFYSVESGTLYRTDQNTLMKTSIDTGVSALSRVGKVFKYVTKDAGGVIVNMYDPGTGSVTRKRLIDTTNGRGSAEDYRAVAIDSAGDIYLYKTKGEGTDKFIGVRVYSASGDLVKEIATAMTKDIKGVFAPKSEDGTVKHMVVQVQTGTDTTYFTGINLLTGAVSNRFGTGSFASYPEVHSYYYSGGITYLYGEGFYYNDSMYYCGYGFAVAYNGSSVGNTSVGRIGTYDEDFAASDRIFTAMFGDNSSTNATKIKISALPKTLAQETAEVIGKYANADTYVGGVGTTASQVRAATLDLPQKVLKIDAANDGYLNLNGLPLTLGKKYYYEYDLSPLTEGTKERLTGVTASTGTVTSDQSFLPDTLYVTDSYEEYFNGDPINPFFTVNDQGTLILEGFSSNDPAWKGYGAYYNSSKENDGYMKLSFTVPAGKQAVVTLDYALSFYNGNNVYSGTNILIDGATIRDKNESGNNADHDGDSYKWFRESATGAVFYKLLGPGTHTIEATNSTAKSHQFHYALIDNLKVDILSTSPRISNASFNVSRGDSTDWLYASGTFEVPTRVISYGAQESYPHYGPLPSDTTYSTILEWNYDTEKYDRYNLPTSIVYHQDVPAGFLQKGRVHIWNTYVNKNSDITFNINGYGQIYLRRYASASDSWIDLGRRGQGSYTHNVSITIEKTPFLYGGMDVFDLLTYPKNYITENNNMAFNADNTRYFFPKVTSNQSTSLSMFVPKGQYYLKNLKLYYYENGQKVYVQNKSLTDVSQLAPWNPSSGVTVTNATITEPEKDDEYIKIYKKGEKVLYNIFYDDYEEDPSKLQYWQYSHINWPPDTVHPDVGKVLTSPIDRFYLSGKYTVTHWQQDNTQRTGTVGDATPYNKESNKVSLTFYVDGGGKAPWITYIKTEPAVVKENNSYTIKVGIDDSEKDTLTLETEVYLNGKIIKADVKTGIIANDSGAYPEQIIGGLSSAVAGVYQIICTVSDYSGTGIKSYKFTVVSEGKITGFVNHTDKWDVNRKKYNLKRFQDEMNRLITMEEYLSKAIPRPRGINVFWSGEQFLLSAETEGDPAKVTVKIMRQDSGGMLKETGYEGELRDTGRKNPSGAGLWEGSLWNQTMINRWGRKKPEELTFVFTAYYSEGLTKNHSATIIVDTEQDYWQLHRLW